MPCHGPSHHIRVWKNAEKFGKKLNADLEILVASCLLHDIAAFDRTSISGHDLKSAKKAAQILKEIKFPKDKISIVSKIISNHRSRSKTKTVLEGEIMKAFDKVDAFGTIGIYRIITPMTIRGYDLDMIVKWFLDDGKLEAKWQAIKFKEIRGRYRKDYLYTLRFFKELAKFRQ